MDDFGRPLTPTSPYSCLSLFSTETVDVAPVLREYSVTETASDVANVRHFVREPLDAGLHKEQELILFFVAMQILQRHPSVQLLLHRVSRLHMLIASNTHGDIRPYTIDGQAEEFLQSDKSALSLHYGPALTLQQAVIHLPDFDTNAAIDAMLHLSVKDVASIRRTLAENARKPVPVA